MQDKLIERQVLYDGQKVRLELHRLEDQVTGRRHKKEVCVHRGAVVILPFLAPDRILLIRNRRYTIGEYLVELPAGTLEKGEDSINCAGRELMEETGYLAGRLKLFTSFFTSPGILTERMYAYAAYDLQKGQATPEEGEEIELLPADWDEAIGMVRDGLITDGKTIAALLTYDRFHRQSETAGGARPT